MKKLVVLLTALVFGLGIVGSAVAESPFYAKAVFIEKITSSQKGYQIVYFDNQLQPITVYVPIEWFYKETGATSDGFVKAEMIYGEGPQFPYMDIFWKDGKFHHLRIFANADLNDASWGVLNNSVDISSKFDPNADINFKFER